MVRSQQSLMEGGFRLTLLGTCARSCVFLPTGTGAGNTDQGRTGSGSGPLTISASDLLGRNWASHRHNFRFCGSREPNFQREDTEMVYSA